ncbi:MAG: pyridoxal-phosphate dependent enzyme [Peptococcaceae bacterium]|nr:pyridoxal-phosphate dependent enzyme [Candidatus Syntrophopropionicum ammoniitolerans]
MNYKDGNNKFFMKHDELLPFSFGGNKVRIAQKYFEDMNKKGCDCMIAYGNSRSNLCRVIANMSKAKGIPCIVISPADESGSRVETSNSMIVKAMDANIIPCNKADVAATVASTMDEYRGQGLNPYYIYGDIYGKGNERVAVQAYVEAYEEILQYEAENGIIFDYIFHASGTGITQAGLICGSLLHGDNRQIIGISVARDTERGCDVIADNILAYMERQEDTTKTIHFEDKYLAGGYGKYNDQIEDTIKRMLNEDGIPLDTTYTGKAFWGTTEYLKEHSIEGKNILFIHTGGLPLFFDKLAALTKL